MSALPHVLARAAFVALAFAATTAHAEQRAALRIYRDPATGALTPEPPAVDKSAPASPRRQPPNYDRVRYERLPDGGVRAIATERQFHSSITAKPAGDGTLHVGCVQGDHTHGPSQGNHAHGPSQDETQDVAEEEAHGHANDRAHIRATDRAHIRATDEASR